MANEISNIYKGQICKNKRLKGASSPRLKDAHKKYNQECGECVVIKKVVMDVEQNEGKPLTPEQRVKRDSFRKYFTRHAAKVVRHPREMKGAIVNGEFVSLKPFLV